jgi:CheY-like chemotaxis protein
LNARTGLVHADPGHIEQVVMNLAVNARDAMPDGGRLLVETGDRRIDEQQAREHLDLPSGDYITLLVTDNGTGMPPEVVSRIFEPFFTTKEQGKGTGLGLSTVYGIVKQAGGTISVRSEPGRGTSFEILFPSAKVSEFEQPAPPAAPAAEPSAGTILVVEDETGVRKLIREILASHGYTILEACNGREGLQVAQQFSDQIHLLLTDVVMPKMGGTNLAERFSALRPGVPILQMSGYAKRLRSEMSSTAFIEKPFTPAALLQRVREILSAANHPA